MLALLLAGAAAQPLAQQRQASEVRYCSNCATVEAVVPPVDARPARQYEVRVRYTTGKPAIFRFDNDPGLKPGDKVKVNDGALTLDRG